MQIEEPDMLYFPVLEELHDRSARVYCLLMFVKIVQKALPEYIVILRKLLESILLINGHIGVNG